MSEISNQDPNKQPPKIEFPCEDYMVKVVREEDNAVHEFVMEVMRRHAPDLDEARISLRASRNGTFSSVTFYIVATGEAQIKSMIDELIAHPGVRMVI